LVTLASTLKARQEFNLLKGEIVMTDKIKQLSTKLHENSAHRASILASAEDVIKWEMKVVRMSLGLTGITAFFYHDQDMAIVSLDICDSRYADWKSWDNSEVKDEDGLLKNLADKLSELATQLEWNGVRLVV
jgi:hypothetical protein